VFEFADTQRMCAQLGVGTQFSAPYAHHMLGKAERPWRTLRDCAHAMMQLKLKLFTTCTVCADLQQVPYAPVAVSRPSQLCNTGNLQVWARPLTT
jgi:transposase InsO family protein